MRYYLLLGVLATSLYGWAQYRGHSLFADNGERDARGPAGHSRIHHK